jgi:hypothetical protein
MNSRIVIVYGGGNRKERRGGPFRGQFPVSPLFEELIRGAAFVPVGKRCGVREEQSHHNSARSPPPNPTPFSLYRKSASILLFLQNWVPAAAETASFRFRNGIRGKGEKGTDAFS